MNILQTPFELLALFDEARTTPSDINEHVEFLYNAVQALGPEAHVTEMGTRKGVSTVAILTAQPKRLVCYDLCHYSEVANKLWPLRGRTDLEFITGNTLKVDIEETDLLFIDTLHTYNQLSMELSRHAGKVRSYLLFHDTVSFGAVGEDGTEPGLQLAISDFLSSPEGGNWERVGEFLNNNGLLLLGRRT